jgi:hypothetical protein
MAGTITIDVDGLTVGELADFIANARFAGAKDGTVTLSSSRQLGESVSEHCYAVLQGPPLPGRDH